jgi:hypothetical protein
MSVVSNLLQDRLSLRFTILIGPAAIKTIHAHIHCKIHHISVPNEDAQQQVILEIKSNGRYYLTERSPVDGFEYFMVHARHYGTLAQLD